MGRTDSTGKCRRKGTSPGLLLFAASFLLCLALPLRALDPGKALTQYGHDSWQAEDGLPNNMVTSLYQDGRGYLWVATLGSLARFDGVRFQPLPLPPAPDNSISTVYSLVPDKQGGAWVLSPAGLERLQDGELRSVAEPEEIARERLTCATQGRDGALWLGTFDHGLLCWVKEGVTRYGKREGLASEKVRALTVDEAGTLWVGTDGGGLARFEDGRFFSIRKGEGIPDDTVSTLLADRDGSLWAGTPRGLAHLQGSRWTTYDAHHGLAHDFVLTLYQDRGGTVWIGTYGGGVCRMKGGRFEGLTSEEGLANDLVLCLLEDREGSLWVGTLGGLDRLRDDKVTVFTTREGLSDDLVWCTTQGRDGSLWVGTRKGLNRMKGGKITIFTTRDGLPDDLVWSLLEDREGRLWVGTRGGLARIEGGRVIALPRRLLPHPHVLALLEDEDGSLWVGTESGLLHMSASGNRTYTVRDGLASDSIMFLHRDREGRLWVATRGGLDCLDGGKFRHLPVAATSLLEDAEGRLWITTMGEGLVLLQGDKRRAFTMKDGLPEESAFMVLEDRSHDLWIGGTKGIYRVAKADLLALDGGARRSLEVRTFGRADGLKSSECAGGCQPTGCVLTDGKVCFATMKGLALLDPGHLRINMAPPDVVLEEMSVSGRPVPLSEGAEFGPDLRNLSFRFTALSLLVPSRVRFQVMLEGLEPEWRDIGGHRSASYPRLPPGRYRFRVRACNNDGVWNHTGAAISFRVLPHFYQTAWFIGLAALLLAFSAWGVYEARVRTLKVREAHLREEVARATGELDRANAALTERSEDLERANELLRKLSYLDPLTGIPNRRHFQEVLDMEWRRCVRTKLPLALVMADIDRFKAYNDNHGHQAGDACLKHVAGLMVSAVNRAGDLVARYGGEEFVLVLPVTETEGAVGLAEEVRRLVESTPLPGTSEGVTLSLGVACVTPDEKISPWELLTAADEALYRAKQEGRNRVAVSP